MIVLRILENHCQTLVGIKFDLNHNQQGWSFRCWSNTIFMDINKTGDGLGLEN